MSANQSDAAPLHSVPRASNCRVRPVPHRVLALCVSRHPDFSFYRTPPSIGRSIVASPRSYSTSDCSRCGSGHQRFSVTSRHTIGYGYPRPLSGMGALADAQAHKQMTATPNHALPPGFGVQLPSAALIRPAHSRAPGPESLSLGPRPLQSTQLFMLDTLL